MRTFPKKVVGQFLWVEIFYSSPKIGAKSPPMVEVMVIMIWW